MEQTEQQVEDDGEGVFEQAANKLFEIAGDAVGNVEAAFTDQSDEFIRHAALIDLFEIRTGRIAMNRAHSAQVRQFAQGLIFDHLDSSEHLYAELTAEQQSHSIPAGLDSRLKRMVQQLRKEPRDRFDRSFLDQQRRMLREALTLMKHYRDHGDDEQLRQYAAKRAPEIERYGEIVKQREKALSEPPGI